VDDREKLWSTTGEVLPRLGYTVEFVSDGLCVIELFRHVDLNEGPLDAVIMDLAVSGRMGGKEALVRILEIDPYVNAIVSSGYSNAPIMADYQAYGFKLW
jgi:two-component system, cell cycle sensor histidine kinase and response regulator CckA